MWLDLDPFTLIANKTWSFDTISGFVNIKFFPKLTKIYLDFMSSNHSLVFFMKDINFEAGLISDINFID